MPKAHPKFLSRAGRNAPTTRWSNQEPLFARRARKIAAQVDGVLALHARGTPVLLAPCVECLGAGLHKLRCQAYTSRYRIQVRAGNVPHVQAVVQAVPA